MARGRRAIRRTNKPIPSTKCCFRVLGVNFVSNGLLCMCVVGGQLVNSSLATPNFTRHLTESISYAITRRRTRKRSSVP